ncbi:potassium channel family protein [Acinetobacter bereziniae]|uniref:potassium channel family protein n=1 Tax=Acinetobacter bereziniae TaxID=106648 RepID=UPI00300BEC5B
MNNFFKALGSIHPLKIGISYLALIIISAFLLYLCPEFTLKSTTVNDPNSFSSSIYFTLVTITTLGYGDILPGNEITRILVVILSFGGVALTGLFLNSLAHTISKITQSEDEKKFKREKLEADVGRFIDLSILLKQNFDDFKLAASSLITPWDKYSPIIDTTPLMNLEFKINDLKDLFKINTLRKFPLSKTKIEVFYSTFDILNNNLEQLLKLGYFNFNKEVLNLVVKYLSSSKLIDTRDNILNFTRLDEERRKAIHFMLSNAKEDVEITQIANVMDDYIVLMNQIQQAVNLILNIESLIDSIQGTKNYHN